MGHFRTATVAAVAMLVLVPAPGAPQDRPAQAQATTGARPRFDVASVKPHRATDDIMFALQFHDGGKLTATGSLRMLIRTAYHLQGSQLVGGPDWIDSALFDIEALSDGDPTRDTTLVMLQELLAERFQVRVRTERRERPVYELSLADGGAVRPQLSRSAADCDASRPAAFSPDSRLVCGVSYAPGRLDAVGMTMRALATNLSLWVDRAVIDGTGLEGRYDLQLKWAPDGVPQAPQFLSTPDLQAIGTVDPDAPSLVTALPEQLGLRLNPQRRPVEVVVVEQAQRPALD